MTLRYLLDTIVVSAPFWKTPPRGLVTKIESRAHLCAIASPVWHELQYGAILLLPSRRRSALERFLQQVVLATYPILPYDRAAAEWHATERARLDGEGKTPAFIDGQIASIARVNDLVVVTDNVVHFRDFDGVEVQNWMR